MVSLLKKVLQTFYRFIQTWILQTYFLRTWPTLHERGGIIIDKDVGVFKFLLFFISWCLVSRLTNMAISGLGPVPPLGKRLQMLTSFFVIDAPAFSATLTTFAKMSSPCSSSTPTMLTFSLHPYGSVLSASTTEDRSPAEHWTILSSSTAQNHRGKA